MKKSSNIKMKLNKLLIFIFTFMCTMMNSALVLSADSITSSKPVEGTKALFTDLTSAFLIIIPIGGTLAIMYFLFRKSNADEQDQKKWKDRITNTLICTILAETISALITTVLSYYQ